MVVRRADSDDGDRVEVATNRIYCGVVTPLPPDPAPEVCHSSRFATGVVASSR